MKVYAILVSADNSDGLIMSDAMVDIVKQHRAGIVMNGFDFMKYSACLVCDTRAERDSLADKMRNLGIKLDMRDDGYIDDEYERKFKR